MSENSDVLEAMRSEPDPVHPPDVSRYHEQLMSRPPTPASEIDRILNQLDPGDEEDGEQQAPEPVEAQEQPSEPEPEVDVSKEIHTLKLDGVPDSVISKMSTEEIKEYADKRAEIIRTNDQRLQRIRELEKTTQQPTEQPQASRAEPIAEANVDLEKVVQGYSEEFGEDAGKALKGILEPVIGQMSVQQGDIQATRDAVRSLLVDGARKQLEGEFPQLSDPEKFALVERKAAQIGGENYTSVTDVLRDAATIVFADDLRNQVTEAKVSAEIKRRNDQRTEGQMAAPRNVEVDTSRIELTPDQRQDAILEALESGKTPEEVRAMLGT